MTRVLAAAAVLVAALFGLPLTAAAAAPPVLNDHSVTITIDDVEASAPIPSTGKRPFEVILTLQNNTAGTLKDVAVSAERGDPIVSEAGLDAAIAKPKPPSPDLVAPVHRDPKTATLLPGQNVDIPYDTTTGTDTSLVPAPGICLCANAIYPLYFTATYTDAATGATTIVGTAQTYIPAFGRTPKPAPLRVTWVWPLLDTPHRLSSPREFLDDSLATEVAPGGRLDRALQVVEAVAPFVPMTLVVDPDLLDELEVMAADNYRVVAPATKLGSVPGTGAAVARAWLNRFTIVINSHPRIDVDLTAFADPDVESLSRSGLSWTPAIGDQDTQTRLADALGGRIPERDVAWPVGSTLGQTTLTTLVQQGISTVIVNDTTLPRQRGNLGADAIAPLPTSAGQALAAVTSRVLENKVAAVLEPSGTGLSALPDLVSHLALRVLTSIDDTNDPTGVSHYVVLTAPRVLDVDPRVAERAILATSRAFWNKATTLHEATQSVAATNHGVLHPATAVPGLPPRAIGAMGTIADTLRGLTGTNGLPDRETPAAATSATVISIDKIPVGAQRSASAELLGDPRRIVAQTVKLAGILTRLRTAVHLVPPAGSASYTLTSNAAPLPVTIDNPLDVTAQVQVHVEAQDNRPGFDPQTLNVDIPANSTQQVRVPTHINITGRINVVVSLTTPGQMSIGGEPLVLSVRNTALGTVGVAITTIAAIILALALLFRGIRAIRWRLRRRDTGPHPPVTDPLAP